MRETLRAFSGISGRFAAVWFVFVLLNAGRATAQQDTVFRIDFTNSNLAPSHWVLRVHPDGNGHFDSDPSSQTAQPTDHMTVSELHRDIQLSPALTNQIFLVARSRKFFNFPCESHMKVAFQGNKQLSYSGPDGNGSCTFNYSKDKEIENLGGTLMGVEFTIITGARLEMLLAHDRLGLDQELEFLAESLHTGNAADPGVIRDILTRIANDDQVMDRARKRARALLSAPR